MTLDALRQRCGLLPFDQWKAMVDGNARALRDQGQAIYTRRFVRDFLGREIAAGGDPSSIEYRSVKPYEGGRGKTTRITLGALLAIIQGRAVTLVGPDPQDMWLTLLDLAERSGHRVSLAQVRLVRDLRTEEWK